MRSLQAFPPAKATIRPGFLIDEEEGEVTTRLTFHSPKTVEGAYRHPGR